MTELHLLHHVRHQFLQKSMSNVFFNIGFKTDVETETLLIFLVSISIQNRC